MNEWLEKKENQSIGDAEPDATAELLAEMHRNVTMGAESLSAVVPKIREARLMTSVTSQLEQYADFTRQTEKLLRLRSKEPKEPGILKKTAARSGILLNTLFDSSDRNLCEMIARSTRTGAEQLEDRMTELEAQGCSDEAAELCRDILSFEEEEIDRAERMARQFED